MSTIDTSGGTDAFSTVATAEAEWLAQRRAAAEIPADADTVGLAFSGGGIRSATFNLGVLEALEAAGMMRHVDYLSSVSGGGYIAACYSWLRALLPASTPRLFESPLFEHDGKVVDWLRRHGRYLVAARGYSMATLLASILAATFLNLLVLGPVVVLAVYGMTLGWLPVAWPEWLTPPDVGQVRDHHGYLLLLVAGVASVATFPLTAIAFALVAGVRRLSSMPLVDGLRVLMGRQLGIGMTLLAIGTIPVVHVFGGVVATRFESALLDGLGRHLVYLTPVLSGAAALLAGRRGLTPWRRQLALLGLALIVYGMLVYAYHLAEHVGIVRAPWFAGAIMLSLLLAFVCNINSISMNAYYRARLSESFLPPVVGSDTAPSQFRLDQIEPRTGAPFHLVNTTLNTTSSPDEKNRSRQGASFFFSPLYCGSTATGFGSPTDYSAGPMALSTAFTISGAAIDPNTDVTRSRAMSSLLALLNVRLGYWAENPARRARAHWPLPWWWILIGREMLGVGLDERHARIHLSDGGHFENLGLYELVRRQVRRIVVCDAGADPQLLLADLGRAIERVRVDFGAEIELSADALVAEHATGHARRPYLLGQVRYADGSIGQLLYIKPMLIEGASADLYAYARAYPDFPNQPTANQFFCESEFEAYRVLGREIVGRMLGSTPPMDIAQWFEQLQRASDPKAT